MADGTHFMGWEYQQGYEDHQTEDHQTEQLILLLIIIYTHWMDALVHCNNL